MTALEMPRRLPFWQRLVFAVPLFGWMARDVAYGDPDNLWYALIAVVSMWGCSLLLFGLPGLYLPALAMVPVMFLLLILISRG
ncbi:hypothetical protein FGK63_00050 [Ruegeria sediminis]|uniref:Uncharacterized protein n=1 Tax=Ruegeria sediminis TaxID=2583820 RepID=A0ABY2X335_9RHOB|nr:hypothetical protein [Ruegeria sediminis]TMV09503.1 hypothetical protein FGK63_00050 [Ruegeria sediminis]